MHNISIHEFINLHSIIATQLLVLQNYERTNRFARSEIKDNEIYKLLFRILNIAGTKKFIMPINLIIRHAYK